MIQFFSVALGGSSKEFAELPALAKQVSEVVRSPGRLSCLHHNVANETHQANLDRSPAPKRFTPPSPQYGHKQARCTLTSLHNEAETSLLEEM